LGVGAVRRQPIAVITAARWDAGAKRLRPNVLTNAEVSWNEMKGNLVETIVEPVFVCWAIVPPAFPKNFLSSMSYK